MKTPMFVELRDLDGTRAYINILKIKSIRDCNGSAKVSLTDGSYIIVNESTETVAKLLSMVCTFVGSKDVKDV